MLSAGIFRLLYVMSVFFMAGGDISREISIYQIAAFWFICLLLCVLDAVRPSSAAIEGESKADFKKIGIKAKYILILFTKHCIIKKSYERRYGGIAQLVRAHGSHPWGRRFEPCCLHQAGLGAECALSVYLFLLNSHATKPASFLVLLYSVTPDPIRFGSGVIFMFDCPSELFVIFFCPSIQRRVAADKTRTLLFSKCAFFFPRL